MTPRQCRAARALLGWKQEVLSFRSGVSISAVTQFESGRSRTYPRNIEAMQVALERAGARFVRTHGVIVR